MDDCFPTASQAPQDVIGSLITYTERCAAYLEAEHEQARLHGHVVQGQTLGNLEGYRFTARFLRESCAMPDPATSLDEACNAAGLRSSGQRPQTVAARVRSASAVDRQRDAVRPAIDSGTLSILCWDELEAGSVGLRTNEE